jgi:HAD superfamily hydrolase (TIGR01549 family)
METSTTNQLMPPTPPSLIVTDFDRTLLELLDHAARTTLRDELREVYLRYGLGAEADGADDAYALWARAYWALSGGARSAAHQEATAILTAFELEGAQRAELFPNVRGTLELCGARGVRLAIVSSNDAGAIRLALERAQVLNRFDLVLSRGDAPAMSDMKPSPTLLLAVLQRLSEDRRGAVYVGDSPDDMLAANRSAIAGIGVLTGTTTESDLRRAGAVAVLSDFSAIGKQLS